MTYPRALRISLALALELFWWSAVVGLPILMVFLVLRQLELGVGGPQTLQSLLVALWLLLILFIIFPQSIREAVSRSYVSFHLAVIAEHRRKQITYIESLQISLLALGFYLVLGALFFLLHLSHIYTFLQLPFLVLVVFPATALVAVKVPFPGFRISVIEAH